VNRNAFVVTFIVVLTAFAALATGCGSAKKSGSTTSNLDTGKHETGIAYVKVIPGNQTLQQAPTTTTIVLRSNLVFSVGVKNDGDSPEQNVKVTLKIHQPPPNQTITRTGVIPQISNGQTAKIDFRSPFNIETMISVVPITVRVDPVAGEMDTANNSATYNVRFSF
jgi:hypothetical protein